MNFQNGQFDFLSSKLIKAMTSFSHHRESDLYRSTQNSLSKHQIIHKFKQSEKQKNILKNKLNILKKQCQRNQKKTKSIEFSLKRVNKIKESYKKNQAQIQFMLRKNHQEQQQKIANVTIRKQQNQGKLPLIKSLLIKQRSNDYLLGKKKSYDLQQKLRVYRNSVISQRKKTAHKIKEEDQMVAFNRTLYMQIKSKNVKMQQQQQAALIVRKFKKSRVQLEQMKDLEDSLLQKLNKSRTLLNQSMSKLTRNIRG